MARFSFNNNSQFWTKNTSYCSKRCLWDTKPPQSPSFLPVHGAFLPTLSAQSGHNTFAANSTSNNPDHEEKLIKKLSAFVCGRPVVVVCVGTDLALGDCLGPVVGQLLTEADAPAYIYGTLSNPITALNVQETREFIRINHPNCLVIAVDCAIGLKKEEGLITVSDAPLRPGLALDKQLGAIGDVSVTAVTSSHSPEKREFLHVRLGFIYTLARRVAGLILNCLPRYII